MKQKSNNSNNICVGIIGHGFVGSAISFGMAPFCEVRAWDIQEELLTHKYRDVLACEFIFVCVPTPSNILDGYDLNYIEEAFERLSKNDYSGLVILKSTVSPGTTAKLAEKYAKLDIVYSPEFLTARTAKLDFMNPNRVIIGIDGSKTTGDVNYLNKVGKLETLFRDRFKGCPKILTHFEAAEFVKCMTNNFFAVKLSFMNKMRELADKQGINWSQVIRGFVSDQRVAESHIDVPGPDGKLGFGGACLPKDLDAMITHFEGLELDCEILKATRNINLKLRSEQYD